ncbi:hypothetical protein PRCB_00500 [Pantoea rodasii]|uniref:Nucleotidyl transferase AbiEii/AbiGii toxin family protein n=1 Tax=Pantoea rodasii TaxID=1076549 RepID=A0A2M9WHY8_9GAMM|nr:hypothetical protein [Pantoea rodasii]ORM61350.1 hypothetical protein HA45_20775 [Pantoea rodasii]PJZ07182.1 hypothetical protein PRCB_00500 [Pantoea rodasii]
MEAKQQHRMLVEVARALGPDLVKQVTFVGGCTTALLLTDELTAEQVRHTDDVDLIVHVISYAKYHALQQELRTRGFKIVAPDLDESIPICAMQLNELRVDIMPDDESILGFSNRWYKEAVDNSFDYQLNDEITIKLVSPGYFVATKLEAWLGRGKGDALTSRDIEDIINLIDGREELITELGNSSDTVKAFISEQFSQLIKDSNFEYAVSSQSNNSAQRETIIFERIEEIITRTSC